jgi:hypothetical protein
MGYDEAPMVRRALDLLTNALAGLACLLFVLGLLDSPRVRVEAVAAPLAPANVTLRDATLLVSLVDEEGVGVGDAGVSVFWERDRTEYWVGSAVTDAAGETELAGLPRGRAWVLASAPGFARTSKALTLAAGQNRFTATLTREASLRVRVTDEQGAPLLRATVLVTAKDPLPFGALTDAKGVALVKRLPPSPWSLKVSAPGYETAERSPVTGEVTVGLRKLASITVRVEHPDHRPAPGATVAIAGSTLWPARKSTTGPDGATRISGLLKGAYDLQATLGAFVSEPHVGFNLDRGENADVTLVLEPGRMITAIVTDGEGPSPVLVPNADVVLSSGGLGSFPLLGRTGTDGRVTLGPIPRGPATLAARAEGFVSSALVGVPEPTLEPVRVALVRGATLKGHVVDGRDFPVEGASIEIIGTDSFGLPVSETPFMNAFRRTHFDFSLLGPMPLIPAGELGVMPGPVPPIPAAGTRIEAGADVWALAAAPPPVVPDWVTRSDGRFTANPVTPGRVRAVARHPDYVEGVSALVALGPGGEAEVKIVMLAGGTLAGRVRDDRGIPVEGAEIEVASNRTSLVRVLLTKADGSFELTGIPSDVVVSLRRSPSERRVVLRKTIEVPEGKRTELELEMPKVRDPVRVLVTGNGEPVELAEVTVLSLDPDVPLRETLFTDSDGVAEILDARGLELRLVAEAPGFPRRALVLAEAPESVPLALEQGVIVEGTVTSGRGRSWVDGARVALVSDGNRRVTLTDAEGRFRIADVAPGPAHLTVSHGEFATAELDVTVTRETRADRAQTLDPIDLFEPGSVEGDVVDAEGEPVSGARVAVGLVPTFLPAGALPPGVAQTDSNGHFVLTGVAPGSRVLEALSPVSGRGRSGTVEVTASRVTDRVRITLTEPAGDDGSVLGGNVAVTLGERGSGSGVEVVVANVSPTSEAERAGMSAGDIIVQVDGTAVRGMGDARKRMAGRPGTDVVIEVRRESHTVTLRVQRELVRK